MNNVSPIVVGLDIGTTKVCAIVGRKNEHGKIEVLGVGRAESLGVMRGVISNIDKTVQAIQQAVAEAKKKSGVEIQNVYVGIAGQHVKSMRHRGYVMRDHDHDEISQTDIDKLFLQAQRFVETALKKEGLDLFDFASEQYSIIKTIYDKNASCDRINIILISNALNVARKVENKKKILN